MTQAKIEDMSMCTGSTVTESAVPYNAKGRPMWLVSCPACGREFRRQGKRYPPSAVIPTHAA
jgi:hypothetical protein